jgi:endonuclease/exonuclease/phosphatase family metal-dependent hydrolase
VLSVSCCFQKGGQKAEQDRENQVKNIVKILRGQIEKLPEGSLEKRARSWFLKIVLDKRAKCAVIVAGDFNMECPDDLFESLSLTRVFGKNDVPFTHKWGEGPGLF